MFIMNLKMYSVVLRLVGLVFATIFGLYIYFICLKQVRSSMNSQYVMVSPKIQAIREQCQISSLTSLEKLYLHYPNPKTYSRGECLCTPVQFFAILSMQRSGSGWFETLLNSHVNISSHGEIFSVKERRANISTLLSTLDRVYNLDWFTSAAKNTCTAAVGFKWMLNQGVLKYHEEIVEYFSLKGISAVFLLRRNILHRMISILANAYDQDARLINGTHKSHVHSQKEAEVLAQYKPTIDVSLLLPDLDRAEKMASSALEYFKCTRHTILYYEDLVNNRTKLADVQDFLRVPRRDLRSRHVKIHTRPPREQVENWDDVYNALKETKYKDMLVR